jgi:hypothetical protein
MRVWLRMPFPYGSEFSWDSTGHEEIAIWLMRFGKGDEAKQVTKDTWAWWRTSFALARHVRDDSASLHVSHCPPTPASLPR